MARFIGQPRARSCGGSTGAHSGGGEKGHPEKASGTEVKTRCVCVCCGFAPGWP